MASRLTAEMVKVITEDVTNIKGLRNVIDGEAELLARFGSDSSGKLGNTLFAPFTTIIDRDAGTLVAAIPVFVPLNMVAAPDGATHYKIVSAGAEVDFENKTFVADSQATAIFPWDANPTAVINMSNAVTANSTHPLFLMLGIEFCQQVNRQMNPLKNRACNILAIADVDGNCSVSLKTETGANQSVSSGWKNELCPKP